MTDFSMCPLCKYGCLSHCNGQEDGLCMDKEPKRLTEYDIIHLVGKPLWVEYGTFKEWKVLKEIHVKKGSEFILNFTDETGGLCFSDLKCYAQEP